MISPDSRSCPHCESACLIRVGLMKEITFYRCNNCDEVFAVPSVCDPYVVATKPKRLKREDAPSAGVQAVQAVFSLLYFHSPF